MFYLSKSVIQLDIELEILLTVNVSHTRQLYTGNQK